MKILKLIALSAAVALGTLATAHAAPVDLLECDSQVFIQDNGGADVIYRLTFRDNEGRSQIRQIGEFYEPLHFTRSLLHGDGESNPAL